MLLRDVDNMRAYFGQFAPELLQTEYGKEMWQLYEHGELLPSTQLSGFIVGDASKANVEELLTVIDDVKAEEEQRIFRMNNPET